MRPTPDLLWMTLEVGSCDTGVLGGPCWRAKACPGVVWKAEDRVGSGMGGLGCRAVMTGVSFCGRGFVDQCNIRKYRQFYSVNRYPKLLSTQW